jgi:tRNA dimethylallyltransferase
MNTARHIVVVGTTAAGKSSLAIHLARQFSREVISLDSMQIYRGMEVGTGVVPVAERQGVVHHMIGIIEPTQEYSVSHFQEKVYSILDDNPDKKFIFAGGTGLYTHAVIDRFSFAPTDTQARQSIIDEFNLDENDPDYDSVAQAYLYLAQIDPEAASKIDPLNVRRIIRALEAIEMSGDKFSNTGTGIQTFGEPYIDCRMIGLRYDRDILRQRISERVDTMLESGWIEEAEFLEPTFESLTMPAQNAIGYTPLIQWIRNGKKTRRTRRT